MRISEPRRNLELKARDRDRGSSLHTCRALGLEDAGLLEQRDTYFAVIQGRLKMREEPGVTAQLIAYSRPDLPQWRESRYRIIEVGDASGLKAALAATVGITVEVRKHRRLFRDEGTRIHLDEVEGLGHFIEFELAADHESDLTDERRRLEFLRERFDINERDLVAVSYSDLMLADSGTPPTGMA
jgi:predicted adenylyl cyclase CyaB